MVRVPPIQTLEWVIVVTILSSIVFVAFPLIDIKIAGLFYKEGDGFIGAGTVWANFVSKTLRPALSSAAILGLLVTTIIAMTNLTSVKQWRLPLLYVWSSLIIGPGLIINEFLKSFIGRARPYKIIEFGGEAHFSKAYILSDQCHHNCSFVSGDVGFAAGLLSVALVLPPPFRYAGIALVVILVIAAAYYRMAVGKHFLSDVALAAMFSVITCLALHRFIFQKRIQRDWVKTAA